MFPATDDANTSRAIRGPLFSLMAVLVCIFTWGTFKAGAAVKVIELQHSSPQPSVKVRFGGKPFANAEIDIFLDGDPAGKPRFMVNTGVDGSAEIPKLSTGKYRFYVFAKPKLRGDLYLQVSPTVGNDASHFTIDLECCAPPTFEEVVASAEEQAVQDHLQSFEGVIKDQSGAPIQNVVVDVVVRGTRGKVQAATLRSDLNGRFSGHLEDGQYIAFFRGKGFSVGVVPFTISRQTESGELLVTLKVAPSN
jgi:hypothetical protein